MGGTKDKESAEQTQRGSDLTRLCQIVKFVKFVKFLWASPGSGRTWLLCWWRKRDTFTIDKDDWFQLIWNSLVHHWTVSVPLHMCFKALMRIAPGDIKDLVAWSDPALKALQLRHEDLSALHRDEIHESVSKPTTGVEINWKIHQVV